MKEYQIPEIEIEKFDIGQIMDASGPELGEEEL